MAENTTDLILHKPEAHTQPNMAICVSSGHTHTENTSANTTTSS